MNDWCVISGFRRDVEEVLCLPRCCAALIDSYGCGGTSYRSRVFDSLSIKDATDRLSRNVANYAAGDSRRVKIPSNPFLKNVRCLFKRFQKIAKKRLLVSSCMSVRPSARRHGTARIFVKFYI